ncbi:MAG: hypothetical protein HRU15_08545 [Planctomycetes bacterium]|nr:hypothetical protein [Planctomycetota bacterium]
MQSHLQVFVFSERYKKKDPSHQDNCTLLSLLEKQLKKADKENKESIVQGIIALFNENVQFSLKEKKYSQATKDLKTVASWQAKVGDKESVKLSKNLISYINDYIDEKELVSKLKEKLQTDPSSIKDQARVGRFHVCENEWANASPYLSAGQETTLAAIASSAQQKDLSPDQKVDCLFAITQALEDKANKKDIALSRSLLKLAVAYSSELKDNKDPLSTTLQVKFAMVSESFESELAALGPDPLNDFSFAAGGGTVDESRMLRNGWEAIFDHQNATLTPANFKNSEQASTEVKNGTLIVKSKAGNKVSLRNVPNLDQFKGVHIRFKYLTQPTGRLSIKVPGMNGFIVWVYFYADKDKNMKAGFTTGYAHTYSPQFGSLPINANDWNDLRMIWDGKTAVASMNGVEFKTAPSRPSPDTDFIDFSVGGSKEDCEVHIQSFLVLKR